MVTDTLLFLAEHAGYVLLLSFMTYCTHWLAHNWEPWWRLHKVHHDQHYGWELEVRWYHFLLICETWEDTLDQWLQEVPPLVLLIAVFPDAWWLALVYYINAAFAEHYLDHNPYITWRWLGIGRQHLTHHRKGYTRTNYDGWTCLWDKAFGTYQDSTELTWRRL